MIEFAPGSNHIATLPVAVAPADLACEVELWLSPDGGNKSASSGLVPFTSTGSQQQLSLAVDMPSEEATYHVLIDIYCEGNLIGAYQAFNDVSIIAEKPVLSIERLFVVSYSVEDHADEVVFCDIKNIGATPVTVELTCYTLLFDVFPEPVLKDYPKTFTVNPSETYRYRERFIWRTDARAEVWMVGDWGEESVHLKYRCGYKWPYGGDVKGAELNCVDIGSSYATLRYAQTSMCNDWTFRYKTPPLDPYEQKVRFDLEVKGDPVSSYWPSIHCAIWNLLPGRSYEAECSGGPSWREDSVTFNT